MKMFGNNKGAKWAREDETGELPQFPTSEQLPEFDLNDEEFTRKLELLLDGEKLESAQQLHVEPPKEMAKPVNTDYHLVKDPIRGTRAHYDRDEEDDDDEEVGSMPGWLKGVLLLLASLIVLALVIFAVKMNLN